MWLRKERGKITGYEEIKEQRGWMLEWSSISKWGSPRMLTIIGIERLLKLDADMLSIIAQRRMSSGIA